MQKSKLDIFNQLAMPTAPIAQPISAMLLLSGDSTFFRILCLTACE